MLVSIIIDLMPFTLLYSTPCIFAKDKHHNEGSHSPIFEDLLLVYPSHLSLIIHGLCIGVKSRSLFEQIHTLYGKDRLHFKKADE